MLNNLLERTEAQDAGTIILTGFEHEIVLSSVRTVIAEQEQRNPKQLNDSTSKQLNDSTNKHITSSIPTYYNITNTSWRILKLILRNTKLATNR